MTYVYVILTTKGELEVEATSSCFNGAFVDFFIEEETTLREIREVRKGIWPFRSLSTVNVDHPHIRKRWVGSVGSRYIVSMLPTQGTEAGTAETEGLGPQGDGPVPAGDAPKGAT